MKKAISEAKVQRMRNLVTGKYKDKTRTQIGYVKKEVEYSEGDVWEERGKTWTIKNGIRQNITKLNALRKLIRTPLTCPECGNSMKKRLDQKFYKLRKKCFSCIIDEEHQMRITKTFDEYERDTIGKKLESIYGNVKDNLNEYISNINKKYITESGIIEDWYGGLNKEQYQELVDTELKKLRKKIDNYKSKKQE